MHEIDIIFDRLTHILKTFEHRNQNRKKLKKYIITQPTPFLIRNEANKRVKIKFQTHIVKKNQYIFYRN